MAYELEPGQIAEIDSKLPPQFAVLKDRYPQTINNVAEFWEYPPFPTGYVPKYIDIFYEDDNFFTPSVEIKNSNLISVELEDFVTDPTLIYMAIEEEAAFVQIEGQVILNRLEGVILPDVAVNLEALLKSILNGIAR